MEPATVRQQIREFMENNFALGEQMSSLADDTSFMESGVIDSTGVLELVAFLEETYEVKVEDEEMVPENLDSIANLCAFVARKVGSVQAPAAAEG